MLLNFAAVRMNPDKAAAQAFQINIQLTDREEVHLITVGDGVMIHEEGVREASARATVRLVRPVLLMTFLAGALVARCCSLELSSMKAKHPSTRRVSTSLSLSR